MSRARCASRTSKRASGGSPRFKRSSSSKNRNRFCPLPYQTPQGADVRGAIYLYCFTSCELHAQHRVPVSQVCMLTELGLPAQTDMNPHSCRLNARDFSHSAMYGFLQSLRANPHCRRFRTQPYSGSHTHPEARNVTANSNARTSWRDVSCSLCHSAKEAASVD